ncbi:MAG: DNA topoisomerase, partial [Planctomycetota bacterium]|nr:DNA topoisomerase [Planctomycetota bacterium]
MKLVIAEKPSVAADLAKALPGSFKKHEGYWEGPGWLLAWAIGHLLELAEPEDYDPAYKVWSLGNLPILPNPFERKPRRGHSNQLRLLKQLAAREDVEVIVNACDAAREGELIFREIEAYLASGAAKGAKLVAAKPVHRLWLQSMTKAAILDAFSVMKPATDYDGLGDAAFCRAEADWLIGMNATRGLTKRLKGRREAGVWSAGRVQTPTLALLVHRELKVLAHVPKPYWRLQGRFLAGGHEYEAQFRTGSAKDGEKVWDEARANDIAARVRAAKRVVAIETVTESTRAVPSLHSLTSLQKEANSRYGLSARRTLGAAQRLYEVHKVATYPRTDSNCLPADYRPHVHGVLDDAATGAFAVAFTEHERHDAIAEAAKLLKRDGLLNQARVFNDAGVSDHFAIVPTGTLPDTPLGGDDAKVFELILRRFLAAFLPPSTWEKVTRETRALDAEAPDGAWRFLTDSSRLKVPGWQLVDRRPGASELLPDLGVQPGTEAPSQPVEIDVQADATKPPKRYTEAGLLQAMEKAADVNLDEHEDFDDDEVLAALKSKGLGTPATRADIIEALIEKGYALRGGKNLRASAKGIQLIDVLERIHADHLAKAELTAEMEFHLLQVERGQRARADYMNEVVDSVRGLVKLLQEFEYEDLYRELPAIGACPKCKHDVIEGLKGYRCSREPRSKVFEVTLKGAGKATEIPIAETAAAVEKVALKLPGVRGVTVNAKRTNASMVLQTTEEVDVGPFAERTALALEEAAPAGALKGVDVKAPDHDGCGFTIWKEYRGRYLNREVATRLLVERDTGPLEGFVSQRGDTYPGLLRLGDDWLVAFEAVQGFGSGDDAGKVAPELVSHPVDETAFMACPLGKGQVIETPTHYESTEKGGVKIPRTICKRTMTRDDLRSLLDPETKATNWIEDFISRKGRPFTARLVL